MKTITQAREGAGWTRTELGRRARIHPSRVGAFELGRSIPYPVELKRLAKALRWQDDPDLLLEEVDDGR